MLLTFLVFCVVIFGWLSVAYLFCFLCCNFWLVECCSPFLVFRVVIFVFVCGGSNTMLTFLVFCVVCFVFVCGGSVLLVILAFCVVCFVFVCGGLCCLSF